MNSVEPAATEALSDEQLVASVLQGRTEAFEPLMRRYNQRVFRAVRAIVRDDTEAEDVMQEAYVNAYAHLADFEGRARFSTWMTKIAVHEAFARVRKRNRTESLDDLDMEAAPMASSAASPEAHASGDEMRVLIERAIDGLPPAFRSVFMLRAVEELSVAETAETLDLTEETVKTRLHRARTMIRERLEDRMQHALPTAFSFYLDRCDRVVNGVLARVRPANE